MNQRRNFLKQSAAISAASLTAAGLTSAGGEDSLKPLNIGLIGCGGRGNYLAGREILERSGLDMITAINMDDAAEKVVAATGN